MSTQMRIFVDDKPLADHEAPESGSLAQILAAVTASTPDRMIVEAIADGIEIPAGHLSEPPETDPYAQELRFKTADPSLLVRETLFDAADALRGIREVQQTCASLIQSGDKAGALADLSNVVSVWDQVNRAWELSRAVDGVDLHSTSTVSDAAGTDIEQATARLNESLRELQRALLAMDWSELADVLSFEMDEQADQWSGIMSRLADTVRIAEVQG